MALTEEQREAQVEAGRKETERYKKEGSLSNKSPTYNQPYQRPGEAEAQLKLHGISYTPGMTQEEFNRYSPEAQQVLKQQEAEYLARYQTETLYSTLPREIGTYEFTPEQGAQRSARKESRAEYETRGGARVPTSMISPESVPERGILSPEFVSTSTKKTEQDKNLEINLEGTQTKIKSYYEKELETDIKKYEMLKRQFEATGRTDEKLYSQLSFLYEKINKRIEKQNIKAEKRFESLIDISAKRIVREGVAKGASKIQIYSTEGQPVGALNIQGAEGPLKTLLKTSEFQIAYTIPKTPEEKAAQEKAKEDAKKFKDYLSSYQQVGATFDITKDGKLISTTSKEHPLYDILKAQREQGEVQVSPTKRLIITGERQPSPEMGSPEKARLAALTFLYNTGVFAYYIPKSNIEYFQNLSKETKSPIDYLTKGYSPETTREMSIYELPDPTIERLTTGKIPEGYTRQEADIYLAGNAALLFFGVGKGKRIGSFESKKVTLGSGLSKEARLALEQKPLITKTVYRPTNPYRTPLRKDLFELDIAEPPTGSATITRPKSTLLEDVSTETQKKLQTSQAKLLEPRTAEPNQTGLEPGYKPSRIRASEIPGVKITAKPSTIEKAFRQFTESFEPKLVKLDPSYRPSRIRASEIPGVKITAKPSTIEKAFRGFIESQVTPKTPSYLSKLRIEKFRKSVSQYKEFLGLERQKIGASKDFESDVSKLPNQPSTIEGRLREAERTQTKAEAGFRDLFKDVTRYKMPDVKPKVGGKPSVNKELKKIKQSKLSVNKQLQTEKAEAGFRDIFKDTTRYYQGKTRPSVGTKKSLTDELRKLSTKKRFKTTSEIEDKIGTGFRTLTRETRKLKKPEGKTPKIGAPVKFTEKLKALKKKASISQDKIDEAFRESIRDTTRYDLGEAKPRVGTKKGFSRSLKPITKKTKSPIMTEALETKIMQGIKAITREPRLYLGKTAPKTGEPISFKKGLKGTKRKPPYSPPQEKIESGFRELESKASQVLIQVEKEPTTLTKGKEPSKPKITTKPIYKRKPESDYTIRPVVTSQYQEEETYLYKGRPRSATKPAVVSIIKPSVAEKLSPVVATGLGIRTDVGLKQPTKQRPSIRTDTITLQDQSIKPKQTPRLVPRLAIKTPSVPKTPTRQTPIQPQTPKQTPKLTTIEIPKRPPPKPPVIFDWPKREKREKERQESASKERADFLGTTHVSTITGFRTKKVDITYGRSKTARLVSRDVRKASKGSFSKSKKTSLLSNKTSIFSKPKKGKKIRL